MVSTNLQGVGVASAGPLDMKAGVLIKPTNLPFEHVPITAPVRELLDVPTCLINDCTAGVLGEKEFGAGKMHDDLVFITIGTGIGGGAIVDGHLLLGKDGNAVEIGHITIDIQGKLMCGCGKRGHWEAYCSGRNISNFVKMRLEEIGEKEAKRSSLFKSGEKPKRLTSEDLFAAAKSGDKLSLKLVEELGRLNAVGLANVVNAYDPSLITVGGSVTLENERLVLSPIKEKIKDHVLNRLPEVMVTPLRQDVGLYGAVAAALRFTS
jgi:glucokinase